VTVYYPSSGIELDIVRGTIDTTGISAEHDQDH
jgi:hypothetical protein